MFINQMAEGSAVQIEAKNKDGKEVNLNTEVAGVYEAGEYKMVLVDALRHNGQILVFNSVSCQAYITNADDNKIYKFKLQAILKKEQDGKIYHCLISNEDATEENRRTAKRFGLSAKGTMQLLGSTSQIKGYVRDLSATGISFLASVSGLKIGDKVSIGFVHEISGLNVKVVAQIVRTQEQEKGTLFGCVLNKHDAKYTQVISYLMRQECKVKK